MKIKACVAERHNCLPLYKSRKLRLVWHKKHYMYYIPVPLSKSRKLGLVWQKGIIIYPSPSQENNGLVWQKDITCIIYLCPSHEN